MRLRASTISTASGRMSSRSATARGAGPVVILVTSQGRTRPPQSCARAGAWRFDLAHCTARAPTRASAPGSGAPALDPAIAPGPVRLAQIALEDLAGVLARQRVVEGHDVRHLVVR